MQKNRKCIFRQRIQEVRKERQLTTAQMARMLDRSESTIRMWEQGRSLPDAETLLFIADSFNISVDSLLGRNEINSYYSAYNALMALDKFSPLYFYDRNETFAGMRFDDINLGLFLHEWMQMKNHLMDKVINDDIYKLWLESQLLKAITLDEQETTNNTASEADTTEAAEALNK
jgi:transcriptional regulator with XRE-family HTH domain